MNSFDTFTLAPMSAGDIIDRAVRIYRRNFLALLKIVFGPSLIAYIGTVMYYAGLRNFSLERGEGRVAISMMLIVAGFVVWMFGKAAFYAVLGGSSRSLVDHFFEGKPILARDIYRAVRERFWSLIGALFMVALLLMGAGVIVYFIAIIAMLIGVAAAALLSGAPAFFQVTLGVVYVLLVAAGILLVFLLIYSRVVYVPQVMMVEGKTVFSSISRSFSLAGGEMWRIAALVLFWFYVAWSAWSLLYAPLLYAAYWLGIDPSPFNLAIPFWFNIANQTVTQVSEIIIAPIAMLGFTLLYLDSRVRKEGFDVELLANRLLPPTQEMMRMATQQQPAMFGSATVQQAAGFPSILGLNDYAPVPNALAKDASRSATANAPQDFPGVAVEAVSSPVGAVEIAAEPALSTATTEFSAEPLIVRSPETPPEVRVEEHAKAERSCQWCGTAAGDEDRFCRVCGSVF